MTNGPEAKAAEEIADVFDTWGIRTVAEAEAAEIIAKANAKHYLPMLRLVEQHVFEECRCLELVVEEIARLTKGSK